MNIVYLGWVSLNKTPLNKLQQQLFLSDFHAINFVINAMTFLTELKWTRKFLKNTLAVSAT